MIRRLFVEHPASVGETYLQHLATATSFAATMIVAALAVLVHGLIPCLFVTTGSSAVIELHRRMVTHRTDQARLGSPEEGDV